MGVIEFNAIAPTLLAKGLELIVQKESRKSGRRKTPGPLVLKRLGEIGDVRSAIGSLEFLCLRGDVDGDWGAKVTFSKAKKGSKETSLTKMEEDSLELITRREATLGIFHAVGKVVYNKREDVSGPRSGETDMERLPDYLSSNRGQNDPKYQLTNLSTRPEQIRRPSSPLCMRTISSRVILLHLSTSPLLTTSMDASTHYLTATSSAHPGMGRLTRPDLAGA